MTDRTAFYSHIFKHPDRLKNGSSMYSSDSVQTNWHDAMVYLDGYYKNHTSTILDYEYITTLIREPKRGIGETGFTYREAYMLDEIEDWKQICRDETEEEERLRIWHNERVL